VYGTVSAQGPTRARLDRDAVARTALELADREGLAALSMRRLADALGVGTMTLYGYFRTKEDLLDAVIDAGYADFEPPPPSSSFRDAARELIFAARAVLQRHPALVEIRGAQPTVRQRAYRITEAAVGALMDAGFTPDEAARAFRVLFDYVFGYALVNPHAPSDELRREAHASLVALPPEEFPALTSMAAEMAEAVGGGDQFEYGLERILDGLEARLALSASATTASAGAPAARRRRTGRRAR
jgi:AcrR family transcriptional regulator